MADFWGKLGNSIPKKGYSKYGKSIDRKLKVKRRKHKASKPQKAQKASKPKPEPKWHPVRTYQSKQQALSAAESLRKAQGCPTRVDGTGRGYQVWIKS